MVSAIQILYSSSKIIYRQYNLILKLDQMKERRSKQKQTKKVKNLKVVDSYLQLQGRHSGKQDQKVKTVNPYFKLFNHSIQNLGLCLHFVLFF